MCCIEVILYKVWKSIIVEVRELKLKGEPKLKLLKRKLCVSHERESLSNKYLVVIAKLFI